jgi:uncharacterized protein involved in exopolysaccharide biosynthesis
MPSDSSRHQQITPAVPVRSYLPATTRLPQGQPAPDFSLRDILSMVFKHKGKILCIFLLAFLLSPVVYKLMPKKYIATSTLMVTQGREYSRPSLSTGQDAVRLNLDQILGTETVIIKSNDVMDTSINKVGIETIFPGISQKLPPGVNLKEAARTMLEKDLIVRTGRSSNIMQISFVSRNPECAALMVNQVVETYMEKRLNILNSDKSRLFLEKKAVEYQRQMQESENKLEAFRQKHQVFAITEQKSQLIHQRAALGNTINEAQAQSKELQQKLISLETQMRQIPQTLPAESGVKTQNDVGTQLLALERKEQDLLTKYREDTPFIQSVRSEIRLVKEFLARQQKDTGGRMANDLHQNIQKDIITAKADLSALDVKIVEFKRQLTEVDKDTQSIDLLEKSYNELQRDLDNNRKSYQNYAQKLEESRISEDLDQQVLGSISVIDKAETPLFPEGKKKGLLVFLAAGAFLGLGAGLGLAFVLETLRQGMGTPQKAEKLLDLPVLTAISYQK